MSWDCVPLPLEELTGHRVNYREVVQARKRQPQCTDEGLRNFSRAATSGVVDGLRTGVNYQFRVTALAVTLDGTSVEGDASEESDDTMAVPSTRGMYTSYSNFASYVHSLLSRYTSSLLALQKRKRMTVTIAQESL